MQVPEPIQQVELTIVGAHFELDDDGEDPFSGEEKFTLRREPSNMHDRNAIQAFYGSMFFGHVAREQAQILATFMDKFSREMAAATTSFILDGRNTKNPKNRYIKLLLKLNYSENTDILSGLLSKKDSVDDISSSCSSSKGKSIGSNSSSTSITTSSKYSDAIADSSKGVVAEMATDTPSLEYQKDANKRFKGLPDDRWLLENGLGRKDDASWYQTFGLKTPSTWSWNIAQNFEYDEDGPVKNRKGGTEKPTTKEVQREMDMEDTVWGIQDCWLESFNDKIIDLIKSEGLWNSHASKPDQLISVFGHPYVLGLLFILFYFMVY